MSVIKHNSNICFLGNITVQMVLSTKEADELPSYVTYSVSWGDGSNTSLDDLMQETQLGVSGPVVRSLTHTYEASGDFTLTWTAWNPVSEAHVTKMVSEDVWVMDRMRNLRLTAWCVVCKSQNVLKCYAPKLSHISECTYLLFIKLDLICQQKPLIHFS